MESGMSKDEFRDKVMDERLRELCFEGWRRIDLLRTNKFVELIKERNRWAKESGTIQDFHKRYPIPDTEIKQMMHSALKIRIRDIANKLFLSI